MRFESELLSRFNLATMSGLHGGRRTQTYYRLRLWQQTAATPLLRWYQLQYAPAETLAEAPNPAPDAGHQITFILARYHPQKTDTGPQSEDQTPVDAALPAPLSATTWPQVLPALDEAGFNLHACLNCRFWRQTAPGTSTEAPAGRCVWTDATTEVTATNQQVIEEASEQTESLLAQAALAPGCAHWTEADIPTGDFSYASNTPGAFTETSAVDPPATDTPAAHQASQPGFWTRLLDRFAGKSTKHPPKEGARLQLERSGVGAGTEPCIACHGRLANLGALVVESPEGDPQTYSIWRCRVCHATYLNRWIDRWVRTESLETDETIFRIAPLEAAQVLRLIDATPGADHPQKREQRVAQRETLEALAAASDRLSHEVKQGR